MEELLTGVRAPVKEINIFTVLKFFTVKTRDRTIVRKDEMIISGLVQTDCEK